MVVPITKYVFKSADQSVTNDATVNNDTELTFTAAGSTKYLIEIVLMISCANGGGTCTNGDLRYTFSLPSGSIFMSGWSSAGNGNSHISGASGTENASNLPISANTTQSFLFKGYVDITGAGGAVTFRWSQFVSDASTTTIKAGSYMSYTPIE
jgi:hypothetical protein